MAANPSGTPCPRTQRCSSGVRTSSASPVTVYTRGPALETSSGPAPLRSEVIVGQSDATLPAFCAQFFGSLANKSGSHVRIHDMKPAAFEAVLHFIYTDALPPIKDDDGDSTSTEGPGQTAAGCSKQSQREMMCDWLAAADRYGYGLERMRLMCESALRETIDVENTACTLELADRHHCPQLKAFCVDYIATPRVLTDVLATEGYKYKQLTANSPSLLVDVLEKLTWK